MSYCPDCGIEYREGAAECIDCHVPLLPGPPPTVETPQFSTEAELVTVRTFHGPTASMDAELARNVLKEEGVLSALPGDTGAEVIPGIDVVQLLVRAEDAARADEVLEVFENAEAEFPEDEETPDKQERESQG